MTLSLNSIAIDIAPADNELQSDLQLLIVNWSNDCISSENFYTTLLQIDFGNPSKNYYINGNKIISKDVIHDLGK